MVHIYCSNSHVSIIYISGGNDVIKFRKFRLKSKSKVFSYSDKRKTISEYCLSHNETKPIISLLNDSISSITPLLYNLQPTYLDKEMKEKKTNILNE